MSDSSTPLADVVRKIRSLVDRAVADDSPEARNAAVAVCKLLLEHRVIERLAEEALRALQSLAAQPVAPREPRRPAKAARGSSKAGRLLRDLAEQVTVGDLVNIFAKR